MSNVVRTEGHSLTKSGHLYKDSTQSAEKVPSSMLLYRSVLRSCSQIMNYLLMFVTYLLFIGSSLDPAPLKWTLSV